MSLDGNDIGALVHIAKRERPLGATKWDDAGVAKFLRDLSNRGYGFSECLDRVTAHARDKAARTPAVLMQSISTTPAAPTTPRNPTKTEQCPDCGLRRTACVCDPRIPRKPVVDSTDPTVQEELDRTREALRAGKATT